jgi:hypothetical protein
MKFFWGDAFDVAETGCDDGCDVDGDDDGA